MTAPTMMSSGMFSVAVRPVASAALGTIWISVTPSEDDAAHAMFAIDVGSPAGIGVAVIPNEAPGAMGCNGIYEVWLMVNPDTSVTGGTTATMVSVIVPVATEASALV